FYVCAGFSLYLNRRASLEAWDIELSLRRLAARLRPLAGAAVLAFALNFGLMAPQPAHANALTPKEAAAEVLSAPEFQEYREGKRWAPRNEQKSETRRPPYWLESFFRFVADIGQGVAWIAGGLIVALLLHAALRWRTTHAGAAAAYVAPAALFGMDVRPETLPEDVAAAAAALAREGRVREALSLLYRGALSRLVHGHQVRLQAR